MGRSVNFALFLTIFSHCASSITSKITRSASIRYHFNRCWGLLMALPSFILAKVLKSQRYGLDGTIFLGWILWEFELSETLINSIEIWSQALMRADAARVPRTVSFHFRNGITLLSELSSHEIPIWQQLLVGILVSHVYKRLECWKWNCGSLLLYTIIA